jgi:hypothetical protein
MALGEASIFQSRKSIAVGGAIGGVAKALRHNLGVSARAMCFEVAWSYNSSAALR